MKEEYLSTHALLMGGQKKVHLGRTVLTSDGLDYCGFSVLPAFLYDSIILVFSVTCLFFFSPLACLCVCV